MLARQRGQRQGLTPGPNGGGGFAGFAKGRSGVKEFVFGFEERLLDGEAILLDDKWPSLVGKWGVLDDKEGLLGLKERFLVFLSPRFLAR